LANGLGNLIAQLFLTRGTILGFVIATGASSGRSFTFAALRRSAIRPFIALK